MITNNEQAHVKHIVDALLIDEELHLTAIRCAKHGADLIKSIDCDGSLKSE